MAKYNNQSVLVMKNMLATRLQFLLNVELCKMSQKQLAGKLGVGAPMISKLSRGISKGISFDALLVVAERSKLEYSMTMSYSATGERSYKMEMKPIHPGVLKRIRGALDTFFSVDPSLLNNQM